VLRVADGIMSTVASLMMSNGSVDYEMEAAAAIPEVVLPPRHLPPLMPTPAQPPPTMVQAQCEHDFLIMQQYDLATSVICAMYLVFGVVYSIFGKTNTF